MPTFPRPSLSFRTAGFPGIFKELRFVPYDSGVLIRFRILEVCNRAAFPPIEPVEHRAKLALRLLADIMARRAILELGFRIIAKMPTLAAMAHKYSIG